MAAVTAAMVKELRESTGAGMMECKKALTETDGDMEAAVLKHTCIMDYSCIYALCNIFIDLILVKCCIENLTC